MLPNPGRRPPAASLSELLRTRYSWPTIRRPLRWTSASFSVPGPIPDDDLYGRLGVPADADSSSIERAWRALLKRHHPDVAGTESLEEAKRINVAHDWLADPARRARYDAARIRRARPARTAGGAAPAGQRSRPASARPPGRDAPSSAPAEAPDGLEEVFGPGTAAVRRFLRQAARLSVDDLDRLSVAEVDLGPAMLRHIVPRQLWARVEALETLLDRRLPERALADSGARTAARAFGQAIVLEPFLVHQFADPEPLLEGMRGGWESAVGQARYGPNGREVRALLARLARATPSDAESVAAALDHARVSQRPWPADVPASEYTALRVSAALARRDAAAALRLDAIPSADRARLQEAFAQIAHVAVLRPIFSARDFDALRAPWAAIADVGRDPRPTATVRRA
ncbi:MAG: hypothetical protein FJ038_04650 [Chloroflexi bacterium]|nr:hypothetical protein [Chloroflexota bacterium]